LIFIAIDILLIRYWSSIDTVLLYYRVSITTLSSQYHYVIVLILIHYWLSINTLSVRYRYDINLLSIYYSYIFCLLPIHKSILGIIAKFVVVVLTVTLFQTNFFHPVLIVAPDKTMAWQWMGKIEKFVLYTNNYLCVQSLVLFPPFSKLSFQY
jgi:hypothetical protein